MAKGERRQATDNEIQKKAWAVVYSYPTKGAAWKHITGLAYTFLKECNMHATPEDIERVVKGMNLHRRVMDGKERCFAPAGMSRQELLRLL
jgi:hypothetical protein